MKSGIYSITNTANGKRYIGSAALFARRFSQHKHELRAGRHHSVKLQRAWDKHGPDSFVFEVLETVACVADLIAREQHWIDAHQAAGVNGYNISPVAGSTVGYRHTEESRAKMRREFSLEHRAQIGEAGKGRVPSIEARAKLAAALAGRPKTAETRAKMKQAMAGRKCKPRTPEHIARHAAALSATLAAKRAAKLEATQA
jgi:group I intron endonuclease